MFKQLSLLLLSLWSSFKKGHTTTIPNDAVFAFANRTKCPEGFIPYEKAVGRVIVGAGNTTEDNTTITYDAGKTEGKTSVELTIDNMPAHNHFSNATYFHVLKNDGERTSLDPTNNYPYSPNLGRSYEIPTQGNNKAFSIMQPYVALIFCTPINDIATDLSEIANLTRKVTTLNSELMALTNQIAYLTNNLTSLDTRVQAQQTDIESLEGQLQAIALLLVDNSNTETNSTAFFDINNLTETIKKELFTEFAPYINKQIKNSSLLLTTGTPRSTAGTKTLPLTLGLLCLAVIVTGDILLRCRSFYKEQRLEAEDAARVLGNKHNDAYSKDSEDNLKRFEKLKSNSGNIYQNEILSPKPNAQRTGGALEDDQNQLNDDDTGALVEMIAMDDMEKQTQAALQSSSLNNPGNNLLGLERQDEALVDNAVMQMEIDKNGDGDIATPGEMEGIKDTM